MKFTLDHENPFWISQTNLYEHSILVRIESDDETPSDAARTGQRILDHVENNWDVIRQALVNDLLAVHNEEWADASHNRPTLSPADFLDKLTPTSINFGTWEEEDGLTETPGTLLFPEKSSVPGVAHCVPGVDVVPGNAVVLYDREGGFQTAIAFKLLDPNEDHYSVYNEYGLH